MPMPGTLTVAERIVLHISQHQKLKDCYDVPFDVSQDGIAQALLISRAHAAVELKKLKEVGEVEERLAHIKKGKNKRKVYFLTNAGEEKSAKIRRFAEERGVDVGPLIDMRKARGPEVWRSLSEENRKVLAAASVYRRPFKRSALPETSVPMLPVDKYGYVDLPKQLKSEVQAMLTRDQLRAYHSSAADYWLNDGDYKERLYHLLEAGRIREGEMLVAGKGATLIKESDQDLLDDLSRLSPSAKYLAKIRPLQAECGRLVEDYDYCLGICQEMSSSKEAGERFEGLLIKGRALRDMGKTEEALIALESAERLDVHLQAYCLECEMAEVQILQGRCDKALETLRSMPRMGGIDDPETVERACLLMAKAYLATGHPEDAVRYASKSLAMTRSSDKRPWFAVLAEAYARLGMQEKAQEFEAKAHPPKKWGDT
jgi:tetratricopeptide (TPR) repeat protein